MTHSIAVFTMIIFILIFAIILNTASKKKVLTRLLTEDELLDINFNYPHIRVDNYVKNNWVYVLNSNNERIAKIDFNDLNNGIIHKL